MKRSFTAATVVAAAAQLTLATSASFADLTADQTPFHTYRGLWVSRFEYSNTQASVDSVFANAQALGITDVMFQVRGNADAYYIPKQVNGNYFEHRESLTFDALARAIQQGQQRGIKVHAWLNAMPLWRGTSLPTDQPGNPYVINTHPEYWIRDSNNNPQPLNSSYVIVNPTMPEVKQHIYEVVDDITSKYNVDGIHLDYIRFYHDTTNVALTYPTDPASVARFQSLPGNEGKTPQTHKAEYQAWMADNVTEIVAGIRQTMKSNKPAAQLTAAIWRDANIGYNGYQQDWKTWVDRGLLDAGMPMIYRKGFGTGGVNMDADSGDLYRNNVRAAVNWRGTAGIMPGLGIYMQDNVNTAYNNVTAQLEYARDHGANGVQLFSYTDLLGGNAVDAEVRRAWLDFLSANRLRPPVASITDFEADEGYFPTNITFSGSNVNVAPTSTADRTTEEAHTGIASQKLTINKAGAGTFLARHVAGIGTPGAPSSNLEFPSIGAIGFWLKTTTPDVEVAVALDDNPLNTSTERSYFQNVIPDGEWHFYEWFLNDPSHWNAWAGSNADGTIESRFTLDSIQFRGSELSNILFLDDVEFDAAAVAPDQWTLDSSIYSNTPDMNWTNAANWQGGVPNSADAVANFLRRATAAQLVTVDAPVTVGHITFDNSNSYTLGGAGTITMDVSTGNASITVRNRGAHTIAAALAFSDDTRLSVDHGATLNLTGLIDNSAGRVLLKQGNGTLNLNGLQVHGAGALVAAMGGTTNFNTDAGVAAPRSLSVSAAGADTRVNFNATQHLAALGAGSGASMVLAAGGDKLINTASVNITDARLDLNDNGMIVDYDGATPAADIRAMILSAYAGGSWSGDGITTSANDASHGLGFAEANGLTSIPGIFSGEMLDDTAILITRTRYGDADLSGNVNLNDFNRLAANFGSSGAIWSMGDFNYDGVVNLADFNLLAANFGLSAAGPEVTPDDWSALASAVPEPAGAVSIAALTGAGLMQPRRRRLKR